MRYILSKEEMKAADRRTSEEMHVPSAVLMERAALKVVERVIERVKNLSDPGILIVCGCGNNGGDGLAAGRILREMGYDPEFLILGSVEKMTTLSREQLLSLEALKCGRIFYGSVPVINHDVIVDAVFGISLSRPVEEEYADTVRLINRRRDEGAYVISIDIPSGIDADTGLILGEAVKADETVCCGYLKTGNVLYPGAEYSGKLTVASIGITDDSLSKTPKISCLDDNEIILPDRKNDSNKGTYGKVLIFAGNKDIAGAAVLSARAALKAGCGMVRVFTHVNNRAVIQTAVPEALVTVYGEELHQTSLFESENSLEERIKNAIDWCSVIAAGPGIGTDEVSQTILKLLLKNAGNRPVILDADAINILSGAPDLLSECDSEVILTPHLGEMSRLTGILIPEIKAHIIDVARDYASGYHVTVVLKDSRTVTALRNGNVVINMNGNNGMATAGSGDVLTGIIASLAAQGVDTEKAAYLGVAIHASSGDRAAEELGTHGVTAGEIIKYIR